MKDIANNGEFNYSGYQVVRGEFFAHIKEPSLTFNNCKIYVNAACLNKSPQTDFVHILINPTEKKLVIRPCDEEEKDSFCWRSNGSKRRPKQVTCKIFFAKIVELMDWNPAYRYKLIGKLVHSNGQYLFVFDLKTAEIFKRIISADNKSKSSRIPAFPEDWKDQFGLPYDEHRKSLKVNIVDGYAVFKLENGGHKTAYNSAEQIEIGEQNDDK